MKNIKFTFLIFTIALLQTSLFAEIKMTKIFSDNMMLQRDESANIWGESAPNAKIEVDFAGQKISAKADANGKWKLALKPMKADSQPREMSISENGKNGKTIKNIIIGDIWILAGQSNMEWPLRNTTDAKEAIAGSANPDIRYFFQDGQPIAPAPQKDSPERAKWVESAPDCAPYFSGVGYYFARELNKDLKVPVGLLYAARGATSMFCWIPESAFAKSEILSRELDKFKAEKSKYTKSDYDAKIAAQKEYFEKFNKDIQKAKNEGKPAPTADWYISTPIFDFNPRHLSETPYMHYNAKISPLEGFTVKGILWYQAEGDSGGWKLEAFQEQFKIMVENFRAVFNKPNLPFLFVQLPSFDANWAQVRWEQFQSFKNLKNVGMVNAIDLGEKKNIHPHNKTDIGLRLERIALRNVYADKNVNPYGPLFESVKYDVNTATASFICGKKSLEGRGKPRGFEVLVGESWSAPQSISVVGNTVVLKSDKGAIDGVRYLWKGWAIDDVFLYNSDGLPATSFINKK